MLEPDDDLLPHELTAGGDAAGDAPAVVFLNNLFSSRRTWARLAPEAMSRFRVLTYDLRGQGTPVPGAPAATGDAAGATVASHVDDLVRLLDARGLDEAWLVGTSLSTLICRELALHHPDRVAGMVLGAPVFGPFGGARREYFLKSCLQMLDAEGAGALFRHLYPLVLSDRAVQCNGVPGFLALRETFLGLYPSPDQLRLLLSSFQRPDERPALLQSVACPVLLVAGDNDFLAGAATVDATARLFPRGSQVVLPGAGHLAYIDMPRRFEQLLVDFVAARPFVGA